MDIPGFLFFLRFSNIIFKKTYGPESRFADLILFLINFRKYKKYANFM